MLTVNGRKNYTSCGDEAVEKLLDRVLAEMHDALTGTDLSVYLGGSYGRGDGGVRQDKENGILYNDLDFFVFAGKKPANGEKLLKEVAEKYELELKVDVDFSSIMSVKDMKKNRKRLMMQELKRGYRLVCGEDLLAKYLPGIPAEKLPFSEACRLLLNRGMGLLLAGEKIARNSGEEDFILRNIYKAILGAGDAMLIGCGRYCWSIIERLERIEKSDLPEAWKDYYREAVEFKNSPHRQMKKDMQSFWQGVRDFFQSAMVRCAGESEHNELADGIYSKCCKSGEVSLKNFIKYCIKSHSLPLKNWRHYTMPPVAVLTNEVYRALDEMPEKIVSDSKLYQHWLIFN
ncbi:MAG: hypothetical protein E7058_04260 [Lentisphaerae bacterium]|nr:hypothetical protein [Lentisphaerota bacterium]